jgi:uncharacterized membrane protein YbhN (UPF0104 family)
VLVVARFYDILSLVCVALGVIAATLYSGAGEGVPELAGLAWILAVLAGVMLLAPVVLRRAGPRLFPPRTVPPEGTERRLRERLREALSALVLHVSERQTLSRFLRLAGVTLAVMVLRLLFFYWGMLGLGLQVGVLPGFLAVCVAMVLMGLPIQSIAGLGLTQAGWVAGLAFAGVPQAQAIVLSFGLHLLALVCTVSTGGVSHLLLAWRPPPAG